MKELWKEIPGYNGDYFVSNKGKVKSYKNGARIMKPSYSSKNSPYQQVQLYKNGKYKTEKIHRLVAGSFIPNPEQKKVVNHKDGNPKNNNVKNLEWCTLSENTLHSWHVLGRPYGGFKRKIKCIETGKIYPSLSSCARELGVNPSGVHKALNNRTKNGSPYKCCGKHFEYIS